MVFVGKLSIGMPPSEMLAVTLTFELMIFKMLPVSRGPPNE